MVSRQTLRVAFQRVAHELTVPVEYRGRQRGRQSGGGDGHRLTTAALADSYIQLCHDPLKDLHRWIDETRPGTPSETRPLYRETTDVIQCASVMEDGRRLRSNALHQVQGRMDADRATGLDHLLPARSATGAIGHDGLRSVSAEGRQGLNTGRDDGASGLGEFASELGAVHSYYAARMAAARRSLKPGDVAAAIRALQGEQMLATRAVLDRWMAAGRNTTQKQLVTPQHPVGRETIEPIGYSRR